MKQQEGGDASIELFITIPIHCSDPLFLRALHRGGKGEDFRSIKRQARADLVSAKQAKKTRAGVKRQTVSEVQKASYNVCDMEMGQKQQETISSSCPSSTSSSSTSSLSSMSDLFIIDENDMVEFIDERSKPRFRLLAELY